MLKIVYNRHHILVSFRAGATILLLLTCVFLWDLPSYDDIVAILL